MFYRLFTGWLSVCCKEQEEISRHNVWYCPEILITLIKSRYGGFISLCCWISSSFVSKKKLHIYNLNIRRVHILICWPAPLWALLRPSTITIDVAHGLKAHHSSQALKKRSWIWLSGSQVVDALNTVLDTGPKRSTDKQTKTIATRWFSRTSKLGKQTGPACLVSS